MKKKCKDGGFGIDIGVDVVKCIVVFRSGLVMWVCKVSCSRDIDGVVVSVMVVCIVFLFVFIMYWCVIK